MTAVSPFSGAERSFLGTLVRCARRYKLYVEHVYMQLATTRDTAGWGHDSRDYIRLKNTILIKQKELVTDIDDLVATNEHELTKRAKQITAPEIEARKDVVNAILGKSISRAFSDAIFLSTFGRVYCWRYCDYASTSVPGCTFAVAHSPTLPMQPTTGKCSRR